MRLTTVAFSLIAVVFLLSVPAYADLIDRGADSLGYHLIYDSDQNVTWLDYTHYGFAVPDEWQAMMDWASSLTVDFGNITYDDWRLPRTVDGPIVVGYDGTTTGGWNITTGEMGYLYYTELGNRPYLANGIINPGWPGMNWGPFTNLVGSWYWSGTEYSLNQSYAWYFSLAGPPSGGGQWASWKDYAFLGLAVRDGDVPEPSFISLLFVGLGGVVLAGWKIKRI
jgi:hypothetical protein